MVKAIALLVVVKVVVKVAVVVVAAVAVKAAHQSPSPVIPPLQLPLVPLVRQLPLSPHSPQLETPPGKT